MKKLFGVATLSILLASGYAMAGKNYEPVDSEVVPVDIPNPLYLGLGMNWTGFSTDCPCNAGTRPKDSSYGETVRLGWDFNPFFGIEARYLRNDFGVDFSKISHYGLYLKPQYHVTDLMNVYALGGYGHTDIVCLSNKTKARDMHYNAFSFGAGVEYDLSGDLGIQGDEEEGWGLFADWQNLAMKKGPNRVNVNVVSAGITYDF